jgi:protein transport protein SEC61 subunit gamma-like protein
MDFKPSDIKDAVVEAKQGVIDKYKETRRVLKITEKPDREEFEMSAKVTGAGMLIIGLLGFIFYLASNLIPQFL